MNTSDSVLLFLLPGSLQIPSEGTLADVTRLTDVLKSEWFEAKNPHDGKEFLIYLPNVLCVMVVDRNELRSPIIERSSSVKIH
jgi:hypothetical protein